MNWVKTNILTGVPLNRICGCFINCRGVKMSKILTIVPFGSATIISTGKLYFSKCNRAFSLNAWFCSSACSWGINIYNFSKWKVKLTFVRCRTAHLHVLQLSDQRPAAYEALVEQSQDGRTFQDCLPESSPRTCRGQTVKKKKKHQ